LARARRHAQSVRGCRRPQSALEQEPSAVSPISGMPQRPSSRNSKFNPLISKQIHAAGNKAKLKPKLTEEKFDTMTNLTVNEALRLVGVKVGSGGGGGGAATYDKLEKRLVKKLKELPLDQLDDHIEKTYKTLKAAADAILAEKARKPLAA
jgi:cell division protein FtsB